MKEERKELLLFAIFPSFEWVKRSAVLPLERAVGGPCQRPPCQSNHASDGSYLRTDKYLADFDIPSRLFHCMDFDCPWELSSQLGFRSWQFSSFESNGFGVGGCNIPA
mmetsp:Transcript_2291/g.5437  ORF Transcript_2291/g.5437 Transcript_2291/m.5437 type:complete len:108 (+) Transcript_2291:162-485(+)